MTLAVKKRSKKAGLSPGTLIHIGHAYEDSSRLRLMRYDEAALVEKENFSPGELIEEKKKPGVLWVHLDGLRDIGRLEEIGRIFGLHPLILEDILNTDQRPKAEDFTDYIFIVLKNIHHPVRTCTRSKSAFFWGRISFCPFRKKRERCLTPFVKGSAPTREESARQGRIIWRII